MSDLVEKVQDAVSGYCTHTSEDAGGKCVDCDLITRAAIRAVLAHFAEPWNVSDGMQQGYENLFDPLSEVHTRKAAIAAAMSAALKELGG